MFYSSGPHWRFLNRILLVSSGWLRRRKSQRTLEPDAVHAVCNKKNPQKTTMLTPFEDVSGHGAKGQRCGGVGGITGRLIGEELQEGQRWRAAFRKLKAVASSCRPPRSLLSAASQLYFNVQRTRRLRAEVCAGRLSLNCYVSETEVLQKRRMRWVSSPASRLIGDPDFFYLNEPLYGALTQQQRRF